MSRLLERKNKTSKKLALESEARNLEIQALKPVPNPFAPAIDIYLR
jgi:hypothetical protein